jgi:hypothetical protein
VSDIFPVTIPLHSNSSPVIDEKAIILAAKKKMAEKLLVIDDIFNKAAEAVS